MGIYAWSKYDAHVATRIVRIEEQRIDCVAKLYQKKGMDGEQAIDRARLAYLSYVGWMTRYEANPHFDLEKMVKLLL